MRFIFDTDESFSFETLRAVGYTVYGGAESARSSPPRNASPPATPRRGIANGAPWPTGSPASPINALPRGTRSVPIVPTCARPTTTGLLSSSFAMIQATIPAQPTPRPARSRRSEARPKSRRGGPGCAFPTRESSWRATTSMSAGTILGLRCSRTGVLTPRSKKCFSPLARPRGGTGGTA